MVLNGLPWKQSEIILSFLRLHPNTAFQSLLFTMMATPISSKGFLPTVDVNIHSCHLLFYHFQFALIHGPNIPGSNAILLFTESDFTSITSYIQNWVLFLLWLCPFILSGVISPLISSSILGTYRPGEFIFSVLSFCLVILFMGFSRQEY